MKNTNFDYKKFSLLILLVFILSNPISTFIVTNSIFISLLIFIFSLTLVLFCYYKVKYRFVFQIVFYINIFLFLSLNFEIIFRNNFKQFIINNLYEKRSDYYFNKPNLKVIIEDSEYQTIYKTNEQGYRIGYQKFPINKNKWLFIGDSYTQGAQVNFENLFSTKLEILNPTIRMVNAGISGFGLPEEYSYFIHEGVNFKPQKVFITLCVLNDFTNVELQEYGFLDMLMDKSALARFLLYNYKYKEDSKDKPLGRWVIPFFQNEVDNINCNVLYTKTSDVKDDNENQVESYLKRINDVSKRNNCKMYIILIPTKEQVYPQYLKEVVNYYKIDTSFIDINRSSKLVNKIAKNLNISFIDPINSFRSDTTQLYFKKDEHLNSLGHKKLAEIIESFLLKENK